MDNPLVSIAIITYNQEEYIKFTLDSILQQQHNYSFEIVIGDDCSKDKTREILQSYKDQYPEIIKLIFNEKNLGIIKNYFNVLANCSGKYIMECAGDDYWLPGKIQNQISLMETNPNVGICYSNVMTKNENTGKNKPWNPSEKIDFSNLIYANCIPALSVCFRKDLLEKYIEEINPLDKNWLMEDYPMWLYFSKNSEFKYINEFFGVYRDLNDSESHSYCNIEKRLRFTESTIEVQKFFAEKYNFSISEKYFTTLRANVYFDYILNSSKYDINIVDKYISIYKTVEENKIKFLIKKIILKIPFLIRIFRSIKK